MLLTIDLSFLGTCSWRTKWSRHCVDTHASRWWVSKSSWSAVWPICEPVPIRSLYSYEAQSGGDNARGPHLWRSGFFIICMINIEHWLVFVELTWQAYGTPAWLQPTYNMERQLAALIGDFVQREEKNENNLWIVKPWNMARTIDTSIVESLPALARLVETGPKIGQKYIEKPALFKGRKFDLRYIVLLRSLQPLEIFLCNVFWVSAIFLFLLFSCFVFLLILMVNMNRLLQGRFSNNQYTTEANSLSEYETHFTVMVSILYFGLLTIYIFWLSVSALQDLVYPLLDAQVSLQCDYASWFWV